MFRIDNNEIAKKQMEFDSRGMKKEAQEFKAEFLKQIKESGIDHCPCKEPCTHHGNCYECVVIHRGHRDHLPICMWDMVNEKLHGLARLTEGSFQQYSPDGDK